MDADKTDNYHASTSNTPNTIAVRDSNNNISASTFTGALTGNSDTTTKLQTPRKINNVTFDGSSDITISAIANGGDASTLGNRSTTSFAYSEIGVSDLNTITQSGMYRINTSLSNAPTGVDYGQLLVIHGGADTITQIVTDYGSSLIYWRSGNPTNIGGGGAWGTWREVWHNGNFNPASKAGTAVATNLSNGLMSASDKIKMDAIADNAIALTVSTTTPTSKKSGNVWIKPL